MTFLTTLFIILVLSLIIIAFVMFYRRKKRQIKQSRTALAQHFKHTVYIDHFDDQPIFNNMLDPLLDMPLMDDLESIDNDVSCVEKVSDIPATPKSELIIVLYIVDDLGFAGAKILTLLEALGFKYGHLNIFHHYGFGMIQNNQEAVCSLANMLEPGTFVPQEMSNILIPGLVLFMRLPGPFGGRVGFELMLKNARHISKTLNVSIQDDTHTLLIPDKIKEIRTRIAHFEQRDLL